MEIFLKYLPGVIDPGSITPVKAFIEKLQMWFVFAHGNRSL